MTSDNRIRPSIDDHDIKAWVVDDETIHLRIVSVPSGSKTGDPVELTTREARFLIENLEKMIDYIDSKN